MSIEFEWDPQKSKLNQKKHGITFEQAISLWKTPFIEIKGIARTESGESRSACLGIVGNVLYTAIWTVRKNRIRIISVRRARENEKKIYFEGI
jgi:uncharacterized DUF497 family protein